jgi:outer membrane protein OmpA-like peptidoglycan-associated protein
MEGQAMLRLWAVLAAIFISFGAISGAFAQQDHPILSGYPQSRIAWQDVQNFSEYRIAVGPVTGYRQIADWVDTRGRLTRSYYVLDGERTHADVYQNYRDALAAAGFAIIADGYFAESSRSPAIGSRNWLETALAAVPLPSSEGILLLAGSSTAGGSAFLAGSIERAAGTAYVAIAVTQQRADRVTYLIDVVEVDEAEIGLVSVDAEAIGRDIDEYGRVALYGLHFAHDAATLLPESDPVLAEIAAFLNARADMAFYVVGHTDSTGSLDYNRELSGQRARSVAEALVSRHGIARERLEPHGVGPLVPVFTNAVDRGREQNRRVELVQR